MDARRLDTGMRTAAAGAALLLLSLFLPWYAYEIDFAEEIDSVTEPASGWQALTFTDFFVALACLGILAVVALVATGRAALLPRAPAQLLRLLSALALLLVLLRLLFLPGVEDAAGSFDVERRIGVFVAFLAALVTAVGAAMTRMPRTSRRGAGAAS